MAVSPRPERPGILSQVAGPGGDAEDLRLVGGLTWGKGPREDALRRHHGPGNNISFPTDAKLYGRVMQRLRGIANQSGIKLKQSYRFVGKQLLREVRRKLPRMLSGLEPAAVDVAANLLAQDFTSNSQPDESQSHREV